jgi:exosome complex RNA-binding protein Rrp42 (RNase PH superfamily)
VSASVVEPYKDRISEGTYFFEVILSPMASPSFSKDLKKKKKKNKQKKKQNRLTVLSF